MQDKANILFSLCKDEGNLQAGLRLDFLKFLLQMWRGRIFGERLFSSVLHLKTWPNPPASIATCAMSRRGLYMFNSANPEF